jgi:hypothetical protein
MIVTIFRQKAGMDSDDEHENRWMADRKIGRELSGADAGSASCQSSCNALARRSSCATAAKYAFQWSEGSRK